MNKYTRLKFILKETEKVQKQLKSNRPYKNTRKKIEDVDDNYRYKATCQLTLFLNAYMFYIKHDGKRNIREMYPSDTFLNRTVLAGILGLISYSYEKSEIIYRTGTMTICHSGMAYMPSFEIIHDFLKLIHKNPNFDMLEDLNDFREWCNFKFECFKCKLN